MVEKVEQLLNTLLQMFQVIIDEISYVLNAAMIQYPFPFGKKILQSKSWKIIKLFMKVSELKKLLCCVSFPVSNHHIFM